MCEKSRIVCLLKRANFEKIILLYLLEQIYTKVTKNVNFEILPNVPPFCETKLFWTWQPCSRIWHSCLSGVLKMLPIDFSSQKNMYNQIFRSFRPLAQSFYGFFEKNSTAIISVSVFCCSRLTVN